MNMTDSVHIYVLGKQLWFEKKKKEKGIDYIEIRWTKLAHLKAETKSCLLSREQ